MARGGLGSLGLGLGIVGGILMVLSGILLIISFFLIEFNQYVSLIQADFTLANLGNIGGSENRLLISGIVVLVLGAILVYVWKNKNSSIQSGGDLIVWGIIFLVIGLVAGTLGGFLALLGGILMIIDGLI